MITHLDFESRSECDIQTAGAYIYATHPSTELTWICYAFDDGEVQNISWEEIQTMNMYGHWPIKHNCLIQAVKDGSIFKAFNAFFEELIWEHIVCKKYQWKDDYQWHPIPNIPLKQWRCVMAKSLAHSLPQGLGNVSVAMNLETKKDLNGKRIMLKIAKPKPNWQDTGDKWNEHPKDFEALGSYCVTDVETERLIDHALPELNDFEQYVWFLDQTINRRGVCVDMKAITKAKEFIDTHSRELYKEVFEVSEGFVDKVSRRGLVLEWLKTQNIPLEDLKKKTVGDTLKTQLPANVRRLLELRLELGKTSLAKYSAMIACVGEENRIRDVFIYHGASTGRWTGKLVQIHNLPQGRTVKDTDQCIEDLLNFDLSTFEMFYPDIMTTLSACIRGMFIPAPGHDFLVADYEAIEARVVFWLANEEMGLKKFRNGEDLYVDMARIIYHKSNIDKTERQLGKAAVLGCGYGMGHVKFGATCDQWGIPVDEQFAQRVVSAYRETYRAVVEFWYATEAAARRALSHKEVVIVGRTRWHADNKNLYCTLPSGRLLTYNQAELGPVQTSWGELKEGITFWATDALTKRWTKTSTYGGKLVENCLDKNTLVFTMRGCIPIIDVTKGDKVWDGENWVSHKGVVNHGTKPVGKLVGLHLTPDHLILVGNLWKKAIDMDEKSWQESLRPGLNSVASACFKAGLEMTPKLYASVLAAVESVSKRDRLSEGKQNVLNADMQQRVLKEKNTPVLCLKRYFLYGFIDIPVWFLDVLIQTARLIKIMVVAASESISAGYRIGFLFWNTRRHYLDGMTPDLISTVLKIRRVTFPGIFDWCQENKIAAIAETLALLFIEAKNGRSWTFGKLFVLCGKAVQLSYTIFKEVKRPHRLWKDTNQQEEVYDLLNCGPLNRFTVITAQGPIIVHNCTQAVARDLLANAMLEAESMGYPIAFSVHDEIVSEPKKGFGSVQEFERIISTVPAWAEGCPVSAEGWRGSRYRK